MPEKLQGTANVAKTVETVPKLLQAFRHRAEASV